MKDERILELFMALAFLSIAVFFVTGNLVNYLNVERTLSAQLNQTLTLAIFIFAIITAALLLKDRTRK